MSTANTFSVFPPPRVPRISVPNPHHRKPSLMVVDGPELNIKDSVVIALQEVNGSDVSRVRGVVAEIPAAPSPALETILLLPPPPPRKNTTSERGSTSNHGSPEPESIASSDTLVRRSSDEPSVTPFKSLFPVYNPNVPLSQQNYYPTQPIAMYNPEPKAFVDSMRPTIRRFPSTSIRPSPSNQANVVDIPLDDLNLSKPPYSSPRELGKLWDATHSVDTDLTTSSFDLEMGRIEEAIFAFGSTPDTPFYTLTTFDTAEISIKKTCPRKQTLACDVVLSSVQPPSSSQYSSMSLVSYIFPKMAAMLAINQCQAVTDEYRSAGTTEQDIQDNAVRRAAEQEASSLRWNALERRYELEHPAVARRLRNPNFIMSPITPEAQCPALIHISVATSDQSTELPIILVTCPAAIRSPHSPRVGANSFEASEPLTDIQLASLDFNTNTLHIEAVHILETMPSPFAIDSVLSALCSVAIADPATNLAMGNMKLWVPKASKTNRSSWATESYASPVPSNGAFFATIAEREEAEEEARAAAKNHKKSVRKSKPAKLMGSPREETDIEASAGRTWYGKSKAKKQRKKKQIVIGEFDLEKLTHYQSGAREGQELPAVTRGAVTILVSILKFIVALLSMIVQFICWIMVSVTRGVTSEKF